MLYILLHCNLAMASHIFFILMLLISTSNICNAKNSTTLLRFPAIFVFGDSTVDTGNNNYIAAVAQANHYPYGRDFPSQVPTGRFSNGKIIPDLAASFFGIKEFVPPFLDPTLSDDELRTGVNFASAGSGYDELTSALSGAIPMSMQVEYFRKYIVRLYGILGKEESKNLIGNALVFISCGNNDFFLNYFKLPTRRLQFDVNEYQDFVQEKLRNFVKEIYNLGCRTIVITGISAIGCVPIEITLSNPLDRRCVEHENTIARSYNQKLEKLMPKIQSQVPNSRIFSADLYKPVIDMVNQPQKYGFVEVNKGCCGTGIVETLGTCNALTPMCEKASEYLFWD